MRSPAIPSDPATGIPVDEARMTSFAVGYHSMFASQAMLVVGLGWFVPNAVAAFVLWLVSNRIVSAFTCGLVALHPRLAGLLYALMVLVLLTYDWRFAAASVAVLGILMLQARWTVGDWKREIAGKVPQISSR